MNAFLKKTPPNLLRWLPIAMTTLLLGTEVFAALGRAPQPAPQVTSNQAAVPSAAARQLSGGVTGKAALSTAYSISIFTEPSGTVVREYVAPNGQVFAVVWEGPLLPDLAAFFGDYYAEYEQAIRERRAAGQRGGVVHTSKSALTLVSRGRMGQFEGYAYVPALVPGGVDIKVLFP